MRKYLLLSLLFLAGISINNKLLAQVDVTQADPILICPDGSYFDLDTILIYETANSGITNETGVTYSVVMPAGVTLEPFTGDVYFGMSGNFSNTSFIIFPDSIEITYDMASTASATDTIMITGLRIRSTTASIAQVDFTRSGTATHNGNDVSDANPHGTIETGVALTGINLVATDVTCNGASDGQIAVTVTAGNAPYSYSTDFGSTFPFTSTPITGLSAGGYFVTVRDSAGCIANSTSVEVVNEPTAIVITSELDTGISCNGLSDASITVNATGGTGALVFSIDGGSTFPHAIGTTVTGLGTGTYDIEVEDANNCNVVGSSIVFNDPSVVSDVSDGSTEPSCNGGSDGTLTVNATGGTGTIFYSVNGIGGPYDVESGNATTGLAAGTYDIYYEDENGCQYDGADVTITQPTALTETSAVTTDITCNGDDDGDITATASGGTAPITFSINGMAGPFATANGATVGSLTPGSYSIYYRDNNGCELEGSNVTIDEPDALSEISVTATDIDCNGNTNGTVVAIATGGTGAITFSTNGGTTFPFASGATAGSLGAATYDIFFEDANGCTLDATDATVNEPTLITDGTRPTVDVDCNGASTGSMTVNASGGTGTIFYSINGIGGPYATQVGNAIPNLAAATYDIYYEDANGCQVDGADVTINEPAAALVEVSATRTNVTCNGDDDGTITADAAGGTAPITFSITGSGGPFSYADGATVTNLTPGSYSVYYRDNNGCVLPGQNLNITEPTALTEITVSKADLDCNGDTDGEITAIASGGTAPISFSTDGGATYPFASGATAGSLTAGTYDVFFRDANGCVLDATDATILEPTVISSSLNSFGDPTSGGGTEGFIQFNAATGGTGPYNYSIDGGTSFQTSVTFGGLSSGTYPLQVRDANGCIINLASQTLNDPGNIIGGGVSFDGNGRLDTTVCSGDSFIIPILSDSAETGGGVSYQWQISSNGVSWTDISGATSATYNISGTYPSLRFFRRQTSKGSDDAFSNAVQRGINAGNAINITIPSPLVCIEGNNQVFSASPAPSGPQIGAFSGPGLTDNGNGTANFDPSAAGSAIHDIIYNFTNEFGCVSADTSTIDVRQNTGVTMSSAGTSFNTTDPPVALTGAPNNDGTFSGPGVVGSQFRPNIADTGVNRIIYEEFDIDGCSGKDSVDLTVSVAGAGAQILLPNSPYCDDDGDDIITVNLNGTTPVGFVASAFLTPLTSTTARIRTDLVPGNYTVEYEYIQSIAILTSSASYRVNAKPTVELILNGDSALCGNEDIRVLSGVPSATGAGITTLFTGAPITGQTGAAGDFDPGFGGGPGNYTITYAYEDANGCNDTATRVMTIDPVPSPSLSGLPASYCSNDLNDTIIGLPTPDSLNGTFGTFVGNNLTALTQGSVIFDPGVSVLGAQTFSYTYTNIFGCSDTVSETRNVDLKPTASLSGLETDYCVNNADPTLIGLPNVGGTGVFVGFDDASGTIGSSSGVISISSLTADSSYTYAYIFTSASGCVDTAQASTEINPLPVMGFELGLDTSFCIDESPYLFQGIPERTNSQDAFSYSGAGIATIGNEGQFDPQTAGIGVHEIKYTYTIDNPANSCTDSISQFFTVNDLPNVGFVFADYSTGDTITDLRFCENQDTILLLGNRTTNNYNFENLGTGAQVQKDLITQAGLGYFLPSSSSFTPTTKAIMYRFTSDTTGCKDSVIIDVELNRNPRSVENLSIGFNFDGLGNGDDFCIEDDSVLLTASLTPINLRGFGSYRLDSADGSDPGGGLTAIGSITSDSAWFNPGNSNLTPGGVYRIWYRFTDTITSCRDSFDRALAINPLPIPRVRVSGPTTTIIPKGDTTAYKVCLNGDPISFEGLNSNTNLAYGKITFTDLSELGTINQFIDFTDTLNRFEPENTNNSGIRNVLFEMESPLGCTDSFSFRLNVIDTPSLDIIFDPTFLSSTGAIPEVCNNVDTILISGSSSLVGIGNFDVASAPINLDFTAIIDSSVFSDTAIYAFPIRNTITSATPGGAITYTVSYEFSETGSGIGCTNEISEQITVNRLPDRNVFDFDGITDGQQFCTLDSNVVLSGSATAENALGYGTYRLEVDTGGFPGGITPIGPFDSDQAILDPNLRPEFGYTIFYRFQDTTTMCMDSITKSISINALPEPQVQITSSIYSLENRLPGDTAAYRLCINGDFVNLLGYDNSIPLSSSNYTFTDITENENIQLVQSGTDSVYRFYPDSTDVLGRRQILFDMTSTLGCRDTFSIYVNVLDTPSLDILIDPTFLSSTGPLPEVCANVDTVWIYGQSNLQGNGTLSVPLTSNNLPSTILSEIVAGNPSDTALIVRPSGILGAIPLAGEEYDIIYSQVEIESGRQCSNEISKRIRVNKLPDNFNFTSFPPEMETPPGANNLGVNEFCTETNDVLLVGSFDFSGNAGSGFFKMDTLPNTTTGGLDTINVGQDSAIFISSLKGDTRVEVRYVFTDSVTGCTDSIYRNVYILPEPDMQVRFYYDEYTDEINTTIPITGNPNRNICTNDELVLIEGWNADTTSSSSSASVTPIPYIQTALVNITDTLNTSVIDTTTFQGRTVYTFDPKQIDSLGLYTLQLEYTYGVGCADAYTFNFNLIDTPGIDILIDTTFSTNLNGENTFCKSLDSFYVRTQTDLSGALTSGFGEFAFDQNLSSFIYRGIDTASNQITDTLLRLDPRPTNITTIDPVQGAAYDVYYTFTETQSNRTCTNEDTVQFVIYPQPPSNFNFSLQEGPVYCEYDTLDKISGFGAFMSYFDTGYYKGVGITNFDNDSAFFDPTIVTPGFTNEGDTIPVWYILQTDRLCVDSIQRDLVIHAKPIANFIISDTINSTDSLFCFSDNATTFINQSRQNTSGGDPFNGTFTQTWATSEFAGQDSIIFIYASPLFNPSNLDTGRNVINVEFTSAAGCVDTAFQNVYVYPDPTADFVIENQCIVDAIRVRDFSDVNQVPSNLPNAPTSIVSWFWEFDDDSTSTDQNPNFIAPEQDNYDIVLTVTNSIGCSNTLTQSVFLGEPPVANFTFGDFCEDKNISFQNISTNIGGVPDSLFTWTISPYFNQTQIIDSFIDDDNFTYFFNDPGAYAMRLSLSSIYGCADDTIVKLDIRPVINLRNGVYATDFQNDSIEWRPGSDDGFFSWEQAVPSGPRISGPPIGFDNQKVWITNADSIYPSNEQSYVVGPCFNFDSVARPKIEFQYFSDVQDNTGTVLQYSLDAGRTWENIGRLESGVEWYNQSSLAGNPGNQDVGQLGWGRNLNDTTFNSRIWRTAKHNLDELRNKGNVRLRFAFGSDNISAGSREGFAFTNLVIKERDKRVLVEHFTNSSDLNAPPTDALHNNLMSKYNVDAYDIQYHTDFPNADPINLDNSLEQGARSLFYGVSSVPRTVFEGNKFNNSTVSWTSASRFDTEGIQHKPIAHRILDDARFGIDLTVNKSPTQVTGTAVFTALQTLPAGREYTAFIAVIEKNVAVSSVQVPQGSIIRPNVEFRNIFKKFLPSASGTNIKNITAVNDSRTVNFTWDYSSGNVYDPDSVFIIAFIQDNSTREIYQAATDNPEKQYPNAINESLNGDPTAFALFPNPSSGRAVLKFNDITDENSVLTIYNQMGSVIANERIMEGTENILIDLNAHKAGVYIIQVAHPIYGIRKSKLVVTK